MFQIAPAEAADGPAIEALLDRCFGPARHARTAYRLRDGAVPSVALVARDGDALIGSIQLWPVQIREATGGMRALTLLGPLVAAPWRRCEGIGTALMHQALAMVGDPVVLIGDVDYYRAFGFSSCGTRGWSLPGPVDRERLLVRGGAGLPSVGTLGPATALDRLAA